MGPSSRAGLLGDLSQRKCVTPERPPPAVSPGPTLDLHLTGSLPGSPLGEALSVFRPTEVARRCAGERIRGAVMQHPGLLYAKPYIRLWTGGSVKNCRAVFAIQSRGAGLRSAA